MLLRNLRHTVTKMLGDVIISKQRPSRRRGAAALRLEDREYDGSLRAAVGVAAGPICREAALLMCTVGASTPRKNEDVQSDILSFLKIFKIRRIF